MFQLVLDYHSYCIVCRCTREIRKFKRSQIPERYADYARNGGASFDCLPRIFGIKFLKEGK